MRTRLTCGYGLCTVWPEEGGTFGSVGPIGCPCSYHRRIAHPTQGLAIGVRAKAVGRHGSRVQRARHRRRDFIKVTDESGTYWTHREIPGILAEAKAAAHEDWLRLQELVE